MKSWPTLNHLRDLELRWCRVSPENRPSFISSNVELQKQLNELYTKVQHIQIDWKWPIEGATSNDEVHIPRRTVEKALKPDPTNTNWYDLRFGYSRKAKPSFSADMARFLNGRQSLAPLVVDTLYKKANKVGLGSTNITTIMDSEIFEHILREGMKNTPLHDHEVALVAFVFILTMLDACSKEERGIASINSVDAFKRCFYTNSTRRKQRRRRESSSDKPETATSAPPALKQALSSMSPGPPKKVARVGDSPKGKSETATVALVPQAQSGSPRSTPKDTSTLQRGTTGDADTATSKPIRATKEARSGKAPPSKSTTEVRQGNKRQVETANSKPTATNKARSNKSQVPKQNTTKVSRGDGNPNAATSKSSTTKKKANLGGPQTKNTARMLATGPVPKATKPDIPTPTKAKGYAEVVRVQTASNLKGGLVTTPTETPAQKPKGLSSATKQKQTFGRGHGSTRGAGRQTPNRGRGRGRGRGSLRGRGRSIPPSRNRTRVIKGTRYRRTDFQSQFRIPSSQRYKRLTSGMRSYDGMLWHQPNNSHSGFYKVSTKDTIGIGMQIYDPQGPFQMLALSQLRNATMACNWENESNHEFFCFPPPDRQWLELYLARTLKITILCLARQGKFKHPYAAAINLHRSVFLYKLNSVMCGCCNEVVDIRHTSNRCCISYVCNACAAGEPAKHTCLPSDLANDYDHMGGILLGLYDINECTLTKVLLVLLSSVFSPELAGPKALVYSFNRSTTDREWTQGTMFPTEVRKFSNETALCSLTNPGDMSTGYSLDCLTFPSEPEGKPFLVSRVDTKMSYRRVSKVRNSQDTLVSLLLRAPWFSTGYFIRVPRSNSQYLMKAVNNSIRVQSCQPGLFRFIDTVEAKPLHEEKIQGLTLDVDPKILSWVQTHYRLMETQHGSARSAEREPGQSLLVPQNPVTLPKPTIFLDKTLSTVHKPETAKKRNEGRRSTAVSEETRRKYEQFKRQPVWQMVDGKLLCNLTTPSSTRCMKCSDGMKTCTRCNKASCSKCQEAYCSWKPAKKATTAHAPTAPRQKTSAEIAPVAKVTEPAQDESSDVSPQETPLLTQASNVEPGNAGNQASSPPMTEQPGISTAELAASLLRVQQQIGVMQRSMNTMSSLFYQSSMHMTPYGQYPFPSAQHIAIPGAPTAPVQQQMTEQAGLTPITALPQPSAQPSCPPGLGIPYQMPTALPDNPYALSQSQPYDSNTMDTQ